MLLPSSNKADNKRESQPADPIEAVEGENNNRNNLVIAGAEKNVVVGRFRFVVFAVLVFCTVGVSVAVFFYTSSAEEDMFEGQFEDSATKVLSAIGRSLDGTFGALDSLAVSMVSHAAQTNQSWPFVKVPDFALRVSKTLSLSDIIFVSTQPVVWPETRLDWEAYSLEHGAHLVDDTLSIMETDENYFGPILDEYEVNGVIHGDFGDIPYNTTTRPMLPTWQSYPIIPRYPPFNWDFLGVTSPESMYFMMQNGTITVSEAYLLPDPNNPVAVKEAQIWTDFWSDFVAPNKDPSEPYSDLYFPVFDRLDSVRADSSHQEPVQMLVGAFYWRDIISDILPKGNAGLVAVIESPCNPPFTYRLNGPVPEYLGRGDQHEVKYDGMAIHSTVFDLNRFSIRDSEYTGPRLDEEYCPFSFHLYPSTVMEESFRTKNPVCYTVVAVSIFVFTSVVFLVYDRCVERRQKHLMYSALHSAANVSLLESRVRERTEKLELANKRLEEANRRIKEGAAAQLEHFACMSHEIRTPLNCIIGLSSLLQDSNLDPMQRENLRMIVDSGNLLSTVVDDVLDYSKLESGNVEVVIRSINLQHTLDSVLHLVETRAEDRSVKLKTGFDPSIDEHITTDNRRLQQILFNLLGNAVKFSREGGIVELSVSHCSPAIEKLDRTAAEETYTPHSDVTLDRALRFEVKDYGKGIAKEEFTRIFRPFRQASAETESHFGGSGLGLSISSRLARRLGGTISVSSQVGEWTKFTVDLPFTDFDKRAQEKVPSELSNSSVLLLDPDDATAEQTLDVFASCNLDARRVHDTSDLGNSIDALGLTTRDCICLVHENVYDQANEVVSKKHLGVVLVSFGTNFLVEDSRAHFRSIVRLLPSVLLKHLAECTRTHHPYTGATNEEKSSADVSFESLRVLIAEDNKVNQKVFSKILGRLGVKEICIVENGKLAVEREAAQSFDILFMDAQMPVMDGLEACRLICTRKDGHCKPEIVFCTAQVSEAFRSECLDAGAVDFLPKPCSIDAVRKCLDRVLRLSS